MAETFGASRAGPRHQHLGLPNEDAWGQWRGRSGAALCVADGVGSKTHARESAHVAVAVGLDVLKSWLRGREPTELARALTAGWRAGLCSGPARQHATTFLGVAVRPDGNAIVMRCGDGLIAVLNGDHLDRYEEADRSFMSDTHALIGNKGWSPATSALPILGAGAVIMLATDGVADDLLTEHLPDLLRTLRDHFGPLPAPRRWRALSHELKDWATPGHVDDKTLATLITARHRENVS